MKILAIIGSLRKQNTYNTVKKIEVYHKQLGECDYEYLFLKDANLKLCTGCHLCMTKGEKLCPLQDDRDHIIQKIEEADGVILASPTFSMNVTWVMKNYLDRLSYIMHRPKFFRQKFLLVTVSGSIQGGNDAIKALSFGAFAGRKIGKLIVLNSPGMNMNKRSKQEKKIEKAARQFSRNMKKKMPLKPTFGYLMWFCAFKAVSLANMNDCPADYEFYKDRAYFIDVKLNPIQRTVINIFTGIFGCLVKRGFV